jgi:hypothetical protein
LEQSFFVPKAKADSSHAQTRPTTRLARAGIRAVGYWISAQTNPKIQALSVCELEHQPAIKVSIQQLCDSQPEKSNVTTSEIRIAKKNSGSSNGHFAIDEKHASHHAKATGVPRATEAFTVS